MTLNLTNAHRECASWFHAKKLIVIITLFSTVYTAPNFAAGNTCSTAIPAIVTLGYKTFTESGISSGNSAINTCFNGEIATNAIWYKYIPSFNGHIGVSSCFGGADTRRSIYTGTCGALVCYAHNDFFRHYKRTSCSLVASRRLRRQYEFRNVRLR